MSGPGSRATTPGALPRQSAPLRRLPSARRGGTDLGLRDPRFPEALPLRPCSGGRRPPPGVSESEDAPLRLAGEIPGEVSRIARTCAARAGPVLDAQVLEAWVLLEPKEDGLPPTLAESLPPLRAEEEGHPDPHTRPEEEEAPFLGPLLPPLAAFLRLEEPWRGVWPAALRVEVARRGAVAEEERAAVATFSPLLFGEPFRLRAVATGRYLAHAAPPRTRGAEEVSSAFASAGNGPLRWIVAPGTVVAEGGEEAALGGEASQAPERPGSLAEAGGQLPPPGTLFTAHGGELGTPVMLCRRISLLKVAAAGEGVPNEEEGNAGEETQEEDDSSSSSEEEEEEARSEEEAEKGGTPGRSFSYRRCGRGKMTRSRPRVSEHSQVHSEARWSSLGGLGRSGAALCEKPLMTGEREEKQSSLASAGSAALEEEEALVELFAVAADGPAPFLMTLLPPAADPRAPK